MIIITDIKFYEVPGSIYQLHEKTCRNKVFDVTKTNMNLNYVHEDQITEHLNGRRIYRRDGRDIIIAFDHESAEILGWQHEAWEEMERVIGNQSSKITAQRREIEALLKKQEELNTLLHRANLWTRLKWVFTGVK